MTSRLQAEQRPRPPRPPDIQTTFAQIHHRNPLTLSARSDLLADDDDDGINDRPFKRRKLDGEVVQEAETKSAVSTKQPQIDGLKDDARVRILHHLEPNRLWNSDRTGDEADLPPLPQRPGAPAVTAEDEPKSTVRIRLDVPVPNTPDDIGLPKTAPHLGANKHAGFFPWTGKHHEDVLSDLHVKNGYFDRPPNPPEKELNTARLPLYNSLKNRSGLEGLSVLLSLVFQQKNKENPGSSVSGFKPPPRVTLTEMKRKSWISDLATADVPLRKLSRTIPQGIRGQLLLDQCLTNAVPLNRAIWFVKCVGANEIRSLKRKGTTPSIASGSEAKWLREWTIGVEQFVEAILPKYSEANWKADVKYALRLTTHLYMDELLDRDHFLEWMLRSLSTANNDHFLFWFFLCSIFYRDILRFHKRARKFVDILCTRYRQVSRQNYGGFLALKHKISDILRRVVLLNPRAFLMPDQWSETKDIINQCLEDLPAKQSVFDSLDTINKKTMGFDESSSSIYSTPSCQIVKLLDSAVPPYDIESLSESLRAACTDEHTLIVTCLTWATTRLRSSVSRIFLAARLIRRWAKGGTQVTLFILEYLNDCRRRPSYYESRSARHMLLELFRSKTLSLSHFIQWQSVRKATSQQSHNRDSSKLAEDIGGQSKFDPIQFLIDIPMSSAPEHVINLRNSLLERAGFDVDTERSAAKEALAHISSILQVSLPNWSAASVTYPDLSDLSWAVKCQLSQWIRARVASLVSVHKDQATMRLRRADPLTAERFFLLRSALEQMYDYPVLADVIGLLGTCQDDSILSALVDTVCRHFESFSALGALEFLHHRLCSAYMTLRVIKPISSTLTLALRDLCELLPSKIAPLRLLEQDFAKGDSSRAIAACSPFSNGIAESLEQAGASFTEDFETILISEPHMNEHTMSSLVNVLSLRIEKDMASEDARGTAVTPLIQLLARLRLVRPSQADSFLSSWILRLAKSGVPYFDTLLSQLLSFNVISIKGLYDNLQRLEKGTAILQHHFLGVSCIDWAKPAYEYRSHTKWLQFARDDPVRMLSIIADMPSAEEIRSVSLIRIMLNQAFDISMTPKVVLTAMTQKVDDMLGVESSTVQAADLVGLIDELSLPVLLPRFQLLATTELQKTANGNSAELIEALFTLLQRQVGPSSIATSELEKLLTSVGHDAVQGLRKKTEEVLQMWLIKFIRNRNTNGALVLVPEEVEQFAAHVETMFRLSSISGYQTFGLGGAIIEYLSQCLRTFSSCGQLQPGATSTPGSTSTGQTMYSEASSVLNISFWDMFNLILRLICLKRPHFRNMQPGNTAVTKQMHLEQLRIIVLLASVATHTIWSFLDNIFTSADELSKAKSTRNFMLDVTTTMANDLSEEARMFGQSLLKDKTRHPIVQNLFGSVNSVGSLQTESVSHGLMVIKDGKGIIGPWKPKVWEILDNASGKEEETCLGLGFFRARRG